VIKAEQNLLGTEGGWGDRIGKGAGGRNDPNNVCTCEQKNKKKIAKDFIFFICYKTFHIFIPNNYRQILQKHFYGIRNKLQISKS
jgi:hypothetical protein